MMKIPEQRETSDAHLSREPDDQVSRDGEGDELFIRGVFAVNPEKGLELLFREYYRPLCSHAMRLVFSADAAKDIVADVFCNFFQRECFKRVESSYKFYLYRSVRNDCLKYLRKETGRSFYDLEETEIAGISNPDTPETLLRYEELSRQIESAVVHLPPQCQKVFIMNRYEGRKQKEIADELEISLKTVEAHITRSLKAIRSAILAD